jgi:hypothetical protein
VVDRPRTSRAPFVVIVVATLSSLVACGGGDRATDAPEPTNPSPTNASGPSSGASANERCRDVHAGHQAMMWTAEMADEMLDAGCGWPYDPFLVSLDGGRDDAALDTPFEARRYAELWTSISGSGRGLCSVSTDLGDADSGDVDLDDATRDETEPGRAFGFTYSLAAPGCPEATPTGTLSVVEFGTEAQRDQAAHAEAASVDGAVYVLGRWVIALEGDVGTLGDDIIDLGGQVVR